MTTNLALFDTPNWGMALIVFTIVGVTVLIGLLYRKHNGLARQAKVRNSVEIPKEISHLIAKDAPITLIQLSTTFCAPCRHTAVLLADIARQDPRIQHVEIDITQRLDIAKALKVYRTPTTLVFNTNHQELFRISGIPKRTELLSILRQFLS